MSFESSRYRYRESPGKGTAKVWTQTVNTDCSYAGSAPTSTTFVGGNSRHSCWDETNAGPPYLTGGDLKIQHAKFSAQSTGWGPVCYWHYKTWGSIYPDWRSKLGTPYPGLKNSPGLSETYLTALGTEGWRRYKPLRPHMDLNQSLAELRDIKRSFIGVKSALKDLLNGKYLRSLASMHINWQFGIKPVLSDLINLESAHRFTKKRIAYIIRNNGKAVRRGGPLRNISRNIADNSGNVRGGLCLSLNTNVLRDGGYADRTETLSEEQKIWFEGKFGFYIPVTNSPEWRQKMLIRQGFGINTSLPGILRTIYQATPWSWLIDWASSTGDILANFVAIQSDGIYAEYAYVMATESETLDIQASLNLKNYGDQPCSLKWTYEWKHRRKATPYGFGIDTTEFTPWQVSILVALGISRLT